MVFKTLIFLLISSTALAGAKQYGQKKDYTRQQKIQRGDIVLPQMVTCRLKKRVKTKTGEEKQLTVEIRDVEIVKPKIEKSVLLQSFLISLF